MSGFTRIPVCQSCLNQPAPLSAEFFCSSCKTPFLNRFPLDFEGRCALCRTGIKSFDAAYCFGDYEGTLRELIHLLKYRGMKPLANRLGRFLASALPIDQRFDVVIPMPLHWRRRWQRGFNQSALLAGEVGHRRGVPVRNAVRRIRATKSQTGLSNAKRRENVKGAFRVRDVKSVKGMRVLLVDDVMTTGATGSACASVLKHAGAISVTLVTLARVGRRTALAMPGALSRGAS